MVKAKSLHSGFRTAVAAARMKHPAVTNVSMFSMSKFDADKDLPIVYCGNYNIQLYGLELFHQFDTKKYRKLARYLDYEFLDTRFARDPSTNAEPDDDAIMPRRLRFLKPNRPIKKSELKMHHSAQYLDQLYEDKSEVARITEIWLLNLVPWCLLEPRLLAPLKWQVSGTIFAAHLAMQHGWAINLGGGFHHARFNRGDNFCFFSDVFIAIKYIWRHHPLQKFMIVDLDAHQATGLEHDLRQLAPNKRSMVYLVDIFNNSIQVTDTQADEAINLRIELNRWTSDALYLRRLDEALEQAFANFKPSMVIYIAGQDVLKRDQQGLMNITEHGLIKRDELVFRHTVAVNKCPILMLLGGGYLARGVKLFAESIRHLYTHDLIWGGHRPGSRELTRPRQQELPQDLLDVSSSPGFDGPQQSVASARTSKMAGKSPDQGPLSIKTVDATMSADLQILPQNQQQKQQQQPQQQQRKKKTLSSGKDATSKLAKTTQFDKLSRTKRSAAPVSVGSSTGTKSAVPVNAVSQSISGSDGGRRPAKVTRMQVEETASKTYANMKTPDGSATLIRTSKEIKSQKVVKKEAAAEANKTIEPSPSMFSDTINSP